MYKAYLKGLKKDQKPNFQIPLLQICASYLEQGIRPKVMIHSCCAICSSTGLDILCQAMDVYVYFYNPNIHPQKEYQKRLQAQVDVIDGYNHSNGTNIKIVAADYQPQEFFKVTKGLEDEKEGSGLRCPKCYELRMIATAYKAKEMKLDYFATSLTLSPMKNASIVNELGFKISEDVGIKYLASDFKKNGGTLRVKELEQEFNIYRQNYCGCIYGAKQQGIKLGSELS